jgi:O-antigen/teichoic acid export membrane protein
MTADGQEVRNSAWYLLPVILAGAIPLLTLPVYTRLLPPDQYGAWAMAMAYALVVTGVAHLGLTFGYERNFFEHRAPDASARLLYSTVLLVGLLLLGLGLLTWVGRHRLSSLLTGSPTHGRLIVCTFCAQAVMSLKIYYLIFFRNTGQARAHAWYSMDELVGATVLGVVFVAWLRLGVIGIPLGQLVASLAILLALTGRFLRTLPLGFSTRMLREELAISYPLAPRALLGLAGQQLDKYLLATLGTLGAVGVYTVAQRLAQNVFQYTTALENVFTPQLYDRMFRYGAEAGDTIGAYLTPFAYAAMAAPLLLGLFSEEAITWLTPATFHAAVPIAGILCLHYALLMLSRLPQLVYVKRTRLAGALTVSALGLGVVFSVVLIRAYGALGAAIGTTLSAFVAAAALLVLGQRHYAVRWQYGSLASIFGVLLLGVSGAVWLREADYAYAGRLMFKAAVVGLYAAVGVWLGLLNRDGLTKASAAIRGGLAQQAS